MCVQGSSLLVNGYLGAFREMFSEREEREERREREKHKGADKQYHASLYTNMNSVFHSIGGL